MLSVQFIKRAFVISEIGKDDRQIILLDSK
jgi:hypothetical protein